MARFSAVDIALVTQVLPSQRHAGKDLGVINLANTLPQALAPALAVFLPKSDAAFPTIGLLGVWLWRTGRTHKSWLRCAAAGLVLWLGMSFSLALAPIALFAAIWTALDELTAWRAGNAHASARTILLQAFCAAAGFFAPILLMRTVFDLNLQQDVPLGGRLRGQFSLNVLNLFDQKGVTDVFRVATRQNLPIELDEFFAGFDAEARITQLNITRDPRFLQDYYWQTPREVRVGFKLIF